MRTLTAVRADAVDLTPYGRLYDLAGGGEPDVVFTEADQWQDRYTGDAVVSGAAHLGMTAGPDVAGEVRLMEHHPDTSEAIAPIAATIVVPIATQPAADDVRALLLEPGQCLVLRPGVYHAPAMGLGGPSLYYWLAELDNANTDVWSEIADGPVLITVDDHV
jgi:ureidoglycolate lyase